MWKKAHETGRLSKYFAPTGKLRHCFYLLPTPFRKNEENMKSNRPSFGNLNTIFLAVITICLALIVIALYAPKIHADDEYVVRRILYCLDGSDLSTGTLVVNCTG